MKRKSKPMMQMPEETSFWKEKNDKLVKEIVEFKNLRKQWQEDMDYMVREKFITDQKLHRLSNICLDLDKKTKSCFDKIVHCSTDLTEIIGLLNTAHRIKQSFNVVNSHSVDTSLMGVFNKSSMHESQNCETQADLGKTQEAHESSFKSRGGKSIHSGDATLTHKDNESFSCFTPTNEKENTLKRTPEEDQIIHESSFVSRGGKTVLQDGNPGMDSDIDLEEPDNMEFQDSQTPVSKVLSVIYEDLENSRNSDKSRRQDPSSMMTLPDLNCLTFSDQEATNLENKNKKSEDSFSDDEDVSTNVEPCSILENSFVTPKQVSKDGSTKKKSQGKRLSFIEESTLKTQAKRLSFITRKSIGSPLPSIKGRTSTPRPLLLRKSFEQLMDSSGKDIQRPLARRTNSPLSSTTLVDGRFLDKTLKTTQDSFNMTEFIKNASTPIQGNATPVSRNRRQTRPTVCDEESERPTELDSINKVHISTDQEHSTSSVQLHHPDPNDTSFRSSKRRRCPTINPIQKYLECLQSEKSRGGVRKSKIDLSKSTIRKRSTKSELKSRAASRSTKLDSSSEEESTVDKKNSTIYSNNTDLSMNKKTTIISRKNESSIINTTQMLYKRIKPFEPDTSRESESSVDETVLNVTSSLETLPYRDDKTPRCSKRKKSQALSPLEKYLESSLRDSKGSAKRIKLINHGEDGPSEDKNSETISSKENDPPKNKNSLVSPKRRDSPKGSTARKNSKKVGASKSKSQEHFELDGSKEESSVNKRVQSNTLAQEESSEQSSSTSGSSRRKKRPPKSILQQYVESTQRDQQKSSGSSETRSKRAVKKVEYKEPSMIKKLRRS